MRTNHNLCVHLILLLTVISLGLFVFRLSGITDDDTTAVYGVDLIAYYTAAKLLQEDKNTEVYAEIQDDFGIVNSGDFYKTAQTSGFKTTPTRYVYLPIFAAPFQLFTHLSFYPFAKLWFGLNLIFIAVVCFLQWQSIRGVLTPTLRAMLVVSLNLMSFPLFYALKLGQTTIIIYLIVCLVFYCALRGNDIFAGIGLGVIVAMKYSPLIFMLYFLYRRKYLIVSSCLVTVGCLLALSISFYGLPLHVQYGDYFLRLAGLEIAGWSNQSLDAFILRQFSGNNGLNFYPVKASTGLALLRNVVACITALAVFLSFRKNKAETFQTAYPLEFSVVVLCFLLLPLVSWGHYFIMAVLPTLIIICFYFKKHPIVPKTKIIFLAAIGYGMIVFHVDYYRMMAVLGESFLVRLIVSTPFLGACLLLGVSLWLIIEKDKKSPELV